MAQTDRPDRPDGVTPDRRIPNFRRWMQPSASQVIDLALPTFIRRGVGATIANVVADSDLSRPDIARHFASSNDLFQALLDTVDASMARLSPLDPFVSTAEVEFGPPGISAYYSAILSDPVLPQVLGLILRQHSGLLAASERRVIREFTALVGRVEASVQRSIETDRVRAIDRRIAATTITSPLINRLLRADSGSLDAPGNLQPALLRELEMIFFGIRSDRATVNDERQSTSDGATQSEDYQ